MASINSITFDEAAYNPGDTITCTVDYTPDVPSVVPQTFTLTANVNDASGNVLSSSTSDFVVNQPQAGDSVSVSDTGSRTWAEGTTVSDGGAGLDVTFTATA